MSPTLSDPPPPEGFIPATARGPFTTHNGPVFRARAEGDTRSGLWVLDRHCNGMGFLHGGMASAFADSALAWGVWTETGRAAVTVQLRMTYLEIVPAGAWIEAAPIINSVRGDLIHAQAHLLIDGQKLAVRAEAVFRALRRRIK